MSGETKHRYSKQNLINSEVMDEIFHTLMTEGRLTSSEISKEIDRNRSATSHLINRLEDEGLLSRCKDKLRLKIKEDKKDDIQDYLKLKEEYRNKKSNLIGGTK